MIPLTMPKPLSASLCPLAIIMASAWLPTATQAADAAPVKPAPLLAQLHLSHVARDKWRADYVLAEPVLSVNLGPKVGMYRKQAWHLTTPGIALQEQADNEVIRNDGKPFSRFSVDIDLYLPFDDKNYTQFDRFSDGGTDVYMGFFAGDATQPTTQAGQERPLHLALQLTGLAGETVLTPDDHDTDKLAYAYFGPAKPVAAGIGSLILDPQCPPWMAEVLAQSTSKISNFYEQAFQRELSLKPLLMVSVAGFETPGFSMKGGALRQQVVFRLEGTALMQDTPRNRQTLTQIVAHEMAHVWQNDVTRGGIGEDDPWIHEGGAEAIAFAGLQRSGLLSAEQAEALKAKSLADCAKLQDSVASYRGIYACGFKRFNDMPLDIFVLWKAMMDATETTGATYSPTMITAILDKAQKSAPKQTDARRPR